MTTAIELTSRRIRLVRVDDRRLKDLQEWPVPTGADPVQALQAAALPRSLGAVRVVMHHDAMLLRTMLQPPAPPERLDRIVEFELTGQAGDEPVAASWHPVKGLGGDGDVRLLALVARQSLLAQLRKALAAHGGRLAALTHPGVALYHAWRAQGEVAGDGAIIDLGGHATHLALVREGELLFVRSQAGGTDDLVKQLAAARGLGEDAAAELAARLNRNAPDDLNELIRRHAAGIAALLTNNAKFARANLQLEKWEPKRIWVAGAGGQVHGLLAALAERTGLPVAPLNPFAGITPAVDGALLDRYAALPSSFAPVLGAACAPGFELDAMADHRRARARFWRTDGALRAGIAAAAAILVLAGLRQELAISGAAERVQDLGGEQGLVTLAERDEEELRKLGGERRAAHGRVAWIDSQRRSGRIAQELLAAVALEQDPQTCPVQLESLAARRSGGTATPATVVELTGSAQSAGRLSTGDVLNRFRDALRRRYPPIAQLETRPRPIDPGRQQFHFVLTIPDERR